LANRTQGIADKIKQHEEAAKATEEPKEVGKKDSDKKAADSDKKPGDKNPGDKQQPGADGMKPGDAPSKPGDAPGKPMGDSQPGKPGDGKPQDGPPGSGEGAGGDGAGDNQPQPEQPNGRKQLEQAVRKMREAQKRLDEAKRSDAAQDQEQALAALEQARAVLEEILRQLREEEIEKTLVRLEARFRNMLKLQQAVKDATVLLDRKPTAQRDRTDEIEAGRLARKEQVIIAELDKAALLLREDGSAVAFPEAVGQLREDMEMVAERLGQNKVGAPTQRIEQDVIEALQEMIAALENAQKELKQKKQQGMSRPGEPADPPLVDAISELKMIRALQVRVNRRTTQYDELFQSGETPADQLLPKLKKLAEHEQRIHRIARDLHLGKNE
jgi:tetratricopeptide (TPR) repeat protein